MLIYYLRLDVSINLFIKRTLCATAAMYGFRQTQIIQKRYFCSIHKYSPLVVQISTFYTLRIPKTQVRVFDSSNDIDM